MAYEFKELMKHDTAELSVIRSGLIGELRDAMREKHELCAEILMLQDQVAKAKGQPS